MGRRDPCPRARRRRTAPTCLRGGRRPRCGYMPSASTSRVRSGSRPGSTRMREESTHWPRSASPSSRSAPSRRYPSRATRARACTGWSNDRAVVNRMGFNNDGREAVAARLRTAWGSRLSATLRSGRREHRPSPRWYPTSTPSSTTSRVHADWHRVPTTWWSTSAHPTPPACAICRPSSACDRC